jgi:hypothetical protein
MTTRGFYSAVQHRDRPGHVMVRARCRADLDRLLEIVQVDPAPEIVATLTNADYPYRVTMSAPAWETALYMLVQEITYPNFKHAVAQEQGEARERVYMRCWGALLAIEQEDGGVAAAKALQAGYAVDTGWCEHEDWCIRAPGHDGACAPF